MQVKSQYYRQAIHSRRWISLRRQVIMDHPLCVMCQQEGFISPAVECHHIVPVDSAPTQAGKEALMFDKNNIMPLCRDCHLAAHRALHKQSQAYYAEHMEKTLDNAFEKFL